MMASAQPANGAALGLVNLGNTCFLNAVLQALAHTPGFRQSLTAQARGAQPSLLSTFAHVVDETWSPSAAQRSVSPHFLLESVKQSMPFLESNVQQDAHEFLRVLCERLEKENNALVQAFGGKLLSSVKCTGCQAILSNKVEAFSDLSVDLPPRYVVSITRSTMQPRPLRLHDCLRSFARAEQLLAQSTLSCPHCAPALSPAPAHAKQLRLLLLPQVLVVHFKRFNWDRQLSLKMSRYVQFPLRGLRLGDYLVAPHGADAAAVFDLACVIVHHGQRIDFGHYTSYCLNSRDGRWYHFDDERVTAVKDEVVARCEAYILFYARRTADA